jgi:hypothetical protein
LSTLSLPAFDAVLCVSHKISLLSFERPPFLESDIHKPLNRQTPSIFLKLENASPELVFAADDDRAFASPLACVDDRNATYCAKLPFSKPLAALRRPITIKIDSTRRSKGLSICLCLAMWSEPRRPDRRQGCQSVKQPKQGILSSATFDVPVCTENLIRMDYVADPLSMKTGRNAVVYYLFFASHKAVVAKIINEIFGKYR